MTVLSAGLGCSLAVAGNAAEFASSENPRCRAGGPACIDCLMQGECISVAGSSAIFAGIGASAATLSQKETDT